MKDVFAKENVLELAEKAGYGLQINATASDGVHCDHFEKELWGGSMETQKLVLFARLLIAEWEEEKRGPIVVDDNHPTARVMAKARELARQQLNNYKNAKA